MTEPRTQGEYFSMTDERVTALARLTTLPEREVIALALDPDWSNDEEHQEWLDTAPVSEIASWLYPMSDALGLTQVVPTGASR